MLVVASIEMLLAQRVWDMAFFRYYRYYNNCLYIMKIYNPEEIFVMRHQRAWLKTATQDWNVGLAEAQHRQTTIRSSSPSTPTLQP